MKSKHNTKYLPNLSITYLLSSSLLVALLFFGCFTPTYAQNWQTLYDSALSIQKKGEFRNAITILEEAKNVVIGEYGKSHENYALTLNKLGDIYRRLSEFKNSEKAFTESVQVYEKLQLKEYSGFIVALKGLGSAYRKQDQLEESEKVFLKAIDIYEQHQVENKSLLAGIINNLANNYVIQFRYKEAEKMYQKVIEIDKATIGENHSFHALTLNSLGILYRRTGRFREAEKLYLKSLEIHKKNSTSTNSLSLLNPKLNLGDLYFEMGYLEKALKFQNETLHIAEENQSYDNQARILNNLGTDSYELGTYEVAFNYYNKAKGVCETHLGKDNIIYYTILSGIANNYSAQGIKIEETEQLYLKALKIQQRVFSRKNEDYYALKFSLANYYYTHSQTEKALKLYKEVISFYQMFLQNSFTYLDELSREAFYNIIKDRFEHFAVLSLQNYENNPELLTQVYNLQLQHKAILLNTSNQIKNRIVQSGDRKLIDLYDEVQKLKQQLSKLTQLSVNNINAKKQDSIRSILETKDRELIQLSSIYATENRVPTWRDVQSKLEKKQAAVELIRYRSYDYRKQKFTEDINYAALVVTSKTKDNPEVIFCNYPAAQ